MNAKTKKAILGLLAAALTALGAYWGYEVKTEITPVSGTVSVQTAAAGALR